MTDDLPFEGAICEECRYRIRSIYRCGESTCHQCHVGDSLERLRLQSSDDDEDDAEGETVQVVDKRGHLSSNGSGSQETVTVEL